VQNVLSQEEIDLLVKAVSSGEVSPDEIRGAQLQTKIRKYDFRRPDKFSKTQINALNMIHKNFSRILSSYLSAFLRSNVDIKVASVEQLTFDDYIVSVDTTLAILFDVNEMGSAIMELSLPVVFPLLELMLGGNGQTQFAHRPLTDVETSVMQKMTDRMLERYSMVWNDAVPVKFTKQSLESNLRLIYTIPPNEIVMLITFTMQINDQTGMVNICLPFSTIESVLGKLTSHAHHSGPRKNQQCLAEQQGQFSQCPLELKVVAGKIPMTVKDLMGLVPGDVIFTDKNIDEDFEMLVEDRTTYKVQAGISNGKKAVQIVSVPEEENNG